METRLVGMSIEAPCPTPGCKGPCWIWQGTKRGGRDGISYPAVSVYDPNKKKAVKKGAHRVSYETFIGPIPEGHDIHHLCYIRECIAPNHLEPRLPKFNRRDYRK